MNLKEMLIKEGIVKIKNKDDIVIKSFIMFKNVLGYSEKEG